MEANIKKNIDFMELLKDLRSFVKSNIIAILLTLLVIFVGLTTDNFFTFANLATTMANVTPRFIIALGVSGCLITRGTDLSAGRAVGLAGVITCTLMQRANYSDKFFKAMNIEPNIFLVALFIILLLAFFGLLNGIIISIFKVPPFLATLGMQTVIYGINCVYSDAKPIGGLRSDYTGVATNTMFKIGGFGFRYLFLFAIIAGLIFWFLYNKTRYGKYMYAIGGNENAAEVSGVNVTKSLIKIYTLAGCMYGLAGFLLAENRVVLLLT